MSGFIDEEGIYHNLDRMKEDHVKKLQQESEKEYIEVPVYFYHTEDRVKIYDISLMEYSFNKRLQEYKKFNKQADNQF